MEEIDVNLENLLKLGLTPEILRDIDKFTIWMTQNENFFYDPRRSKIVLNKKEIKSELSYLMSLLKSEHLKNGYSEEEFDKINQETKVKLLAKMKRTEEVFDDDINFKSYLLETITRSIPEISKLKNKIFEKHFDELLDETTIQNESVTPIQTKSPKPKKISDKWYALLYLIEIKVYNKKIPVNFEDKLIKSEIEEIGKERCKNTGQGFYRNVFNHLKTVDNYEKINKSFGKDWEKIIIELSNNDSKIIEYINSRKP